MSTLLMVPPIEAILILVVSMILFIPAVCILKMFEAMIEVTTGVHAQDPKKPKRRH